MSNELPDGAHTGSVGHTWSSEALISTNSCQQKKTWSLCPRGLCNTQNRGRIRLWAVWCVCVVGVGCSQTLQCTCTEGGCLACVQHCRLSGSRRTSTCSDFAGTAGAFEQDSLRQMAAPLSGHRRGKAGPESLL
jgi:hypothetical protein